MNDPLALRQLGTKYKGNGDYQKTFECFSKGVELDDMGSHFELGCLYYNGHGVDKDEAKAIQHYEKAAIGGHPDATYDPPAPQ